MATVTLTITDSDATSADLVNAMGRTDATAGMAAIENQLASILCGARRGRVRCVCGAADTTYVMGPATGVSAVLTVDLPDSAAQIDGIFTHPASHPQAGITEVQRFLAGAAAGVFDATVGVNINSGAFEVTYDEGQGATAAARTDYSYLAATSANYYEGASGVGPKLTGGAATVGVLFRPTSLSLTAEHALIRMHTAATRGYYFQLYDGSNSRSQIRIMDSTTARLEINTHTLTLNALHAFCFVMDTNGGNYEATTYLDSNTPASAAVAWTANYTPPTTEQLHIGKLSSGSAAEGGVVAVVVANATALNTTQIDTWMTQVKAGGSLAFPTGTTHLWDAVDAGATWVDQVSSVSLAKVGSPTVSSFTATHA